MGRRRSSDGEFPLLKTMSLVAVDIIGDGNCLFNALSDQIFGHQNKNGEIRAAVIEYMRENRDEFISFINVDVNRRNPKRKNTAAGSFSFSAATEDQQTAAYEAHLETMARGGTYGDNIEIMAFAKAYNTDVRIYNYEASYYIRAVDDKGAKVRPVAHIAYHTWEHYSSIRNIEGPFTGLPNVQIKKVSAEQLAKAQADLPKGGVVQDWMVRSVLTSLPHIIDEELIRKTLLESNGHVDNAVSKLLDGEKTSSPSSPGSSSVERDQEDCEDEDAIRGPRKRQNRVIKKVKKSSKEKKVFEETTPISTPLITTNPIIDLTEPIIPSIELNDGSTPPDFKPSPLPALSTLPPSTSTLPPPTQLPQLSADPRKFLKAKMDEDNDIASTDGDYEDDAASSCSASSRGRSLTPVSSGKSQVKQNGPKRITARERKEAKKATQKQARKTTKRNNAKADNPSPSAKDRNSPTTGMKILYI